MSKPFLVPYKNLLFVVAIPFLVVACGTETDKLGANATTYDGITSNATLSAANAQEIMLKATESMAKSVDANDANNVNNDTTAASPFAAISAVEGDTDGMQQLLYHLTKQASQQKTTTDLPIAAIISSGQLGTQFCGGSISFPNSFAVNADLNGTFTYNNLCYNTDSNGQITINGTILFAETSTTLNMDFDITITSSGVTKTIIATFSCSNGNCSFYSDYVGADGKTYRVADVIVTETNGSYTISASFYHPDYGKVSVITSNPLTFNCENGYPGSGTLNFTSEADDSVATLTFNDCAGYDYSYTISGVAPVSGETGLW